MKTIHYYFLLLTLIFCAACGNTNAQRNAPESLELKIASYNVRNAKGMDNVVDFDRVANVIMEMDADAVAIQELDSATQRSNG